MRSSTMIRRRDEYLPIDELIRNLLLHGRPWACRPVECSGAVIPQTRFVRCGAGGVAVRLAGPPSGP